VVHVVLEQHGFVERGENFGRAVLWSRSADMVELLTRNRLAGNRRWWSASPAPSLKAISLTPRPPSPNPLTSRCTRFVAEPPEAARHTRPLEQPNPTMEPAQQRKPNVVNTRAFDSVTALVMFGIHALAVRSTMQRG
jgi:hypothetical protein